MHGTSLKNRQGFTLVEIMVTMAILAILAVVSMVYLTQYVNKTKCGEVETSAHETLLAAVRFAAENSAQPPGNATALGISLPASVAAVTVGYNATATSPISVLGTAVGNKCPDGTNFTLGENQANGQWN